jgi:C1A family cysteine protease
VRKLQKRNPVYGWIPDLPDQRDYPYATLAAVIPTLPKKVDLQNFCTPVENQGKLGSCTACALVGNLEFLKKRKLNNNFDFSELFLYYNERVIRGTTTSDSGASLRDGIKSLVKMGDCREELWPYALSKYRLKPPAKAYTEAKHFQITKYFRISAITEMKHTLSTGFPFVFGFAVYESFESLNTRETGIVRMPEIGERMLGGHAVMAVGYDDPAQYFLVRNSWGKGWGKHGYFFMPYQYLKNSFLSSDFWTIRDME